MLRVRFSHNVTAPVGAYKNDGRGAARFLGLKE
jgi:hypothetical protein